VLTTVVAIAATFLRSVCARKQRRKLPDFLSAVIAVFRTARRENMQFMLILNETSEDFARSADPESSADYGGGRNAFIGATAQAVSS